MGMTIWIHTLEDRAYSKDSDDHNLMCRFSDELDALCEGLQVKKLSGFLDYTDQELNYEAQDEDDENPIGRDPETGLSYAIEDMQWFDAREGLATLNALRAGVSSGSLAELPSRERDKLLRELDDCISRVTGPAQRGGKFHLTLVE